MYNQMFPIVVGSLHKARALRFHVSGTGGAVVFQPMVGATASFTLPGPGTGGPPDWTEILPVGSRKIISMPDGVTAWGFA